MHCGKAKRVALAILSHVIALGWKVIQRDQRKPSRLWDGGIGVAQLSDKEALGWKVIQEDQRMPSKLRDGGIGVAQLSDEAGMEAHAITLSRKVV